MCRFPRRIENKYYREHDPLSPRYIEVACGRCEECRNKKVSDLLFRADHESADCRSHGGFIVFSTLTFNRQHLNIVEYANELGEIKTCSTWNNLLFTKLRNALNTWLFRQGYDLRYLCTAERGHEGTHRPHYHVIFWITPTYGKGLSPVNVFEKIAALWSDSPRNNTAVDVSLRYNRPLASMYLAKTSPIGFVYNELVTRTETEATKYVVKYCVKDKSEPLNDLRGFENILSSSMKVSEKDMQPRLLQSHGIGLSFIANMVGTDAERADYLLANRQVGSDGLPLSVPRYYIKKLNNITDEISTRLINDPVRIFNGDSYEYKYKDTIAGVEHVRLSKETFQQRTSFGVRFGYASLTESYHNLYKYLVNLCLGYVPNIMNHLSDFILSKISHTYVNSFFNTLRYPSLTQDFVTLRDLGIAAFTDLCFQAYHAVRDWTGTLYSTLHRLTRIYNFARVYDAVVTSTLNAERYERLLPEAVKSRPLLFLPKNN